jgi:hypothetical protein
MDCVSDNLKPAAAGLAPRLRGADQVKNGLGDRAELPGLDQHLVDARPAAASSSRSTWMTKSTRQGEDFATTPAAVWCNAHIRFSL